MKYLSLTIVCLILLMTAPAIAQVDVNQSGYYGQPQAVRGVLSAHDQQEFDKYYAKWIDDSRRNDRDDVTKDADHLQQIMARYNIPPNTPFEQIASGPVPGAYTQPYGYPNGAYGNPVYGGTRLSAGDQQKFNTYYAKWVDATRKGDQDDIAKNAGHMQEIMARYNIPPSTPFQAIASNGYTAGAYNGPNPPYAYPTAQPQRLSDKDQKNFDKAYQHWVDARRKRDMDDVDSNARKMEDIMARYNIPANVPFDQVATPGAAYRK